MKKILLVSLVIVMLSIVLVGCGGCAGEPGEVLPPDDYVNGEDIIDNGEMPDYSHFIGTWQGYAIAVTQSVVITDVQGDMITFYFNNISSISEEFNNTTAEITMPIVNNQIIARNEAMNDAGELFGSDVILTFYDDYIRYAITGLEDDFWWTLTRID